MLWRDSDRAANCQFGNWLVFAAIRRQSYSTACHVHYCRLVLTVSLADKNPLHGVGLVLSGGIGELGDLYGNYCIIT